MEDFSPLPLDVYFYVDPTSKNVSGVFAYHPLGISIRSNSTWQFVRRANTELDTFMATHEAYLLDWNSDYAPLSEAADDEPLDEHVAIQKYDKGELTSDDLREYAKLVYDPEEE